MRRTLLAVFLIGSLSLFSVSGALAINCTDPDLVGIVWSNGEFTMYASPGQVSGTVYMFNPSNASESISGYEFRLDVPSNVFILSTTYLGGGINFATPPEYVVGLATPLSADANGWIALMEVEFFLTDLVMADFFMSPTSTPSIPGQMAYADGIDPNILYPLYPVSGSFFEPVSRLNGPELPWCPGGLELLFSVAISAQGDNDNVAGAALGATDDYDEGIDLPEDPVNSHVWFPHPEWSAPVGDNFAYDIKAPYDPLNEIGQWTFVVEVENSQTWSTTVYVDFTPSFSSGHGIDLELYDNTDEILVPLFPSLQYSYVIPPTTLDTRLFDLFVGTVTSMYDVSVGIDALLLGGPQDTGNLAATATDATDGYDPGIDVPDPPPPPTNFLSVYFPQPTWPLGGRYMRDVRAVFDPLVAFKAWELNVETDQVGTVQLDFSPDFTAGSGIGLFLRDETTGELHDLFPGLTYSYEANGDSRTFFLFVGQYAAPTGLSVLIDAEANSLQDNDNLAATQEGATDDYDPGLDIPDAPPPPSDYVSAHFPHPGWPLGDRYQTDVRAVYDPLEETKTWMVTVETDQSGTMTLDFEPNFEEVSGIGLKLRDLATGQVHDLFPNLSYSYPVYGGASSRSFELMIGAALIPPELEPVSRELAAGWSLIGFPLMPPPGAGSLQDVILDDVPGLAYLYRYLGASGYELALPEDPALQEEGLWIATDQTFTWSMAGEQNLDGVSVPLRHGWTLVGYPLWFPGDIAAVKVDFGGMMYDWWEAVNQGIVSGSVYGYDSLLEDYVLTESLATWTGYWLAGLQDGVSLWFDWPNFVSTALLAPPPDDSEAPLTQRWRCTLQLDDGSGKRHELKLGVSPLATAGFDAAFDYPVPPVSPSGAGTRFWFSHPEWELATGSGFKTDIVAPTSEAVQWNAWIERPAPGPVTLNWDLSGVPADLDFQIYLPEQNRVVVLSMRDQSSAVLELLGTSLWVQIRTPDVTGVDDELPVTAYSLGVHPNPFNPTTEITFSWPRSGRAEVRVFDVRGREVRRLTGGVLPAGRHSVMWNGRDGSGREVASGVFFAVLYADGQRVGPIQKMSLVR
jgi:hypothetical protein